jgi:hypothetical protein
VRDYVNSTHPKDFIIRSLSPGNYSITITMGDNNRSHSMMYVDIVGKDTHSFGPISVEAGNYSTIIALGVEPDLNGNITIKFRDGSIGWVVCAITIEKGIRGVRLEYG